MKMNWQSAAGAAPPAVHLGGPFFTISSMSLLSRFSALFLHFVSNNTTNLIHNINSNWNGNHPNRLMYHIFGFFHFKNEWWARLAKLSCSRFNRFCRSIGLPFSPSSIIFLLPLLPAMESGALEYHPASSHQEPDPPTHRKCPIGKSVEAADWWDCDAQRWPLRRVRNHTAPPIQLDCRRWRWLPSQYPICCGHANRSAWHRRFLRWPWPIMRNNQPWHQPRFPPSPISWLPPSNSIPLQSGHIQPHLLQQTQQNRIHQVKQPQRNFNWNVVFCKRQSQVEDQQNDVVMAPSADRKRC